MLSVERGATLPFHYECSGWLDAALNALRIANMRCVAQRTSCRPAVLHRAQIRRLSARLRGPQEVVELVGRSASPQPASCSNESQVQSQAALRSVACCQPRVTDTVPSFERGKFNLVQLALYSRCEGKVRNICIDPRSKITTNPNTRVTTRT